MNDDSSLGVLAFRVVCAMEHWCIHLVVIVVLERLEHSDAPLIAHLHQSIVELGSCEYSVAFGLFKQ